MAAVSSSSSSSSSRGCVVTGLRSRPRKMISTSRILSRVTFFPFWHVSILFLSAFCRGETGPGGLGWLGKNEHHSNTCGVGLWGPLRKGSRPLGCQEWKKEIGRNDGAKLNDKKIKRLLEMSNRVKREYMLTLKTKIPIFPKQKKHDIAAV